MGKIKDAERSRSQILQSALHEMHCKGFQASSVNTILAVTGLTKGAFYHHFPTKQSLGYAVLEQIKLRIQRVWLDPLDGCDDPLSKLQELLDAASKGMVDDDVRLGCPLNNLAQELSSEDEDFRTRIAALYDFWRKNIAEALRRGQKAGHVNLAVDPLSTATFFIASLTGGRGLSKAVQSKEIFEVCSDNLGRYLESLRA